MAHVTGGKITFSETRQLAQYEPRQVQVELAFSIEDGEELDSFLDVVSSKAAARVKAMLTGTVVKSADVVPPQKATPPVEATPEETKPAPRSGRGRAKSKDPLEADEDDAQVELLQKAVAKTPEPTKAALDLPDDTEDDFLSGSTEDEAEDDITDVMLTSAATKKNEWFRKKDGQPNPVAIKKLIGKFTKPPHHISSIAKDQRRAFLDALEAL